MTLSSFRIKALAKKLTFIVARVEVGFNGATSLYGAGETAWYGQNSLR